MTNSFARILVTDDEPLALKATSRLLTSAGYEVLSATTGEQTLRMAEEHHPDVMLLDVVLPDNEGTEICRRIKANPQTADIFIILLSGIRTGSDEQSQGMEDGADGYIVRPIANRELLARIQAYLRVKTAEQKLKKYSQRLEEMVEERTHELCEAQEKLIRQEKLAVLGQMAGSVGHELRNPLAVISSAVYFLKMAQPDASDKVKEYLNLIQKNINISDKIINDLLDFNLDKSADREAVSIPELIQQTLERFPTPESAQVTLDLPEEAPQAYADPQHILQILGNLILNAYQAMPPQNGKLAISSRILDGMVCVTVQDNGTGIPPENMQILFEPLFTTKPKGIGLGLVVSRQLAEANGGRIEVESEAGVGSTFTLVLPAHIG
jgi:signal transduction histidine kinase